MLFESLLVFILFKFKKNVPTFPEFGLYNTRKEDQVVVVCLPFSLCLHSVSERADDVSCLREIHMLTGR